MKKLFIPLIALVLLGNGCPLLFRDTPAIVEPPMIRNELQLLDIEGAPLPNNVVRKEHRIGDSPCPDPLPPVILDLPDELSGAELPLTTAATWLDLPDSVTAGEPLEMQFNCDIADFTDHSEVADVNVDLDYYIKTHPGLDHLAGTPQGGTFFVIVDACNGPCVADFALPYVCCSDCPPIMLITGGKPPAPQK